MRASAYWCSALNAFASGMNQSKASKKPVKFHTKESIIKDGFSDLSIRSGNIRYCHHLLRSADVSGTVSMYCFLCRIERG